MAAQLTATDKTYYGCGNKVWGWGYTKPHHEVYNAIIISFSPHERNCDECFVNNKGNAKSNMATDLAI